MEKVACATEFLNRTLEDMPCKKRGASVDSGHGEYNTVSHIVQTMGSRIVSLLAPAEGRLKIGHWSILQYKDVKNRHVPFSSED